MISTTANLVKNPWLGNSKTPKMTTTVFANRLITLQWMIPYPTLISIGTTQTCCIIKVKNKNDTNLGRDWE